MSSTASGCDEIMEGRGGGKNMPNPFTIFTSFSSFPISPGEPILSWDAVCTIMAGHAVHAGQTCKFSTVKVQSTRRWEGGGGGS